MKTIFRYFICTIIPCLWGIFVFPIAQATTLEETIKQAFIEKQVPEESFGVYIQNITKNEMLLKHNEFKPFKSGSLMKLVTTYAALDQLGPSFKYETSIYTKGDVINRVLHGNLYIKASGDPDISQSQLSQIINQVHLKGIDTITGDIIIDKSVFSPMAYDAAYFDQKPYKPYNAGADAFLIHLHKLDFYFDFNSEQTQVDVAVSPKLQDVTILPPVIVDGECQGWQDNIRVSMDGKTIRFDGVYPNQCGYQMWPMNAYFLTSNSYFEHLFRSQWQLTGGQWKGRVQDGHVPENAQKIIQWTSKPLANIVYDTNKYSNNVMARQLFLTLAHHKRGDGVSEKDAQDIVKTWLRQKNISTDGFVIENGSGLSREEQITPWSLYQLLCSAQASSVKSELIASLSIVGRDGTVRNWLKMSDVAGKGHFKTGTIQNVRTIAGYLQTKNNQELIVIIMVNHENAWSTRQAISQLLERLYEDN